MFTGMVHVGITRYEGGSFKESVWGGGKPSLSIVWYLHFCAVRAVEPERIADKVVYKVKAQVGVTRELGVPIEVTRLVEATRPAPSPEGQAAYAEYRTALEMIGNATSPVFDICRGALADNPEVHSVRVSATLFADVRLAFGRSTLTSRVA